MSAQQKSPDQLDTLLGLAAQLARTLDADGILLLVEAPLNWPKIRKMASGRQVLVAGDTADELEGATENGLGTVLLNTPDAPVLDRLTQALLGAVANDQLSPAADVVALYSGFEAGKLDSLSCIRLNEHLGRLTARDLRRLETKVPLETLKTVVDLAVDIGREGREGKPVGTIFVVGDSRSVLKSSGASFGGSFVRLFFHTLQTGRQVV